MEPELRLREIVQTFQQHPDSLRIKKLIYATCRRSWENNADVLNQQDWHKLVGDLRDRNLSLEQLRGNLFRVVASLNRKAQYTLVAQAILDRVAVLYQNPQTEATQALSESATQTRPVREVSPYEAIAQSLEHHPAYLRIKKLIYGVCHQTWENDPRILEKHPLKDLIRQLHAIAPTTTHLAIALNRKAASLNRKVEYLQVAHLICQRLNPLYSAAIAPDDHTMAAEPEPVVEQTQTLASVPTAMQDSKAPSEVLTGTADVPELTLPNLESPDYTMPELAGADAPSFEGLVPPAQTGARPNPADHRQAQDLSNLFELRLNIVQYANPLRVKLLLFSSLMRTFDFSDQDWSVLRSQTMEDLLRQFLETYTSLDEADVNLTRAAYALPHSEEHAAVASALLRAIGPYYPSGSAQTPQFQLPHVFS